MVRQQIANLPVIRLIGREGSSPSLFAIWQGLQVAAQSGPENQWSIQACGFDSHPCRHGIHSSLTAYYIVGLSCDSDSKRYLEY